MKVLIVCSKNSGKIAPFIEEQVISIANFGIETAYFTITQKGVWGYLNSYGKLKHKIAEFNPDIIHAHYGLSGLLANLQRKVPVVTTYTGSDINVKILRLFSSLSILMSRYNIFMTTKQKEKVKYITKTKSSVIPYGILIDTLVPLDKMLSREKLGFGFDEKLVLFGSKYSRIEKNAPLAFSVIELLDNTKMIELNGKYIKEEMCYLFNAVDACLMTSLREGSPQFIKEAMACNCPIVSVDVGDVKEVVNDTEGCFVCETYQSKEIAEKLNSALKFGKRTKGRERLIELGYDMNSISKKIISVYQQLIKII